MQITHLTMDDHLNFQELKQSLKSKRNTVRLLNVNDIAKQVNIEKGPNLKAACYPIIKLLNVEKLAVTKYIENLQDKILEAHAKKQNGKLESREINEIIKEHFKIIKKKMKESTEKQTKLTCIEIRKNKIVLNINEFKKLSTDFSRTLKLIKQIIPCLFANLSSILSIVASCCNKLKLWSVNITLFENCAFTFQANVSKRECNHPCYDCSNINFAVLQKEQNGIPVS